MYTDLFEIMEELCLETENCFFIEIDKSLQYKLSGCILPIMEHMFALLASFTRN